MAWHKQFSFCHRCGSRSSGKTSCSSHGQRYLGMREYSRMLVKSANCWGELKRIRLIPLSICIVFVFIVIFGWMVNEKNVFAWQLHIVILVMTRHDVLPRPLFSLQGWWGSPWWLHWHAPSTMQIGVDNEANTQVLRQVCCGTRQRETQRSPYSFLQEQL